MKQILSRHAETWLYVAVWLVIILVGFVIDMRARALADMPLVDGGMVEHNLLRTLPFLLLFVVNDRILIPRLLFTNRVRAYFGWCAVAVLAVWVFQYERFMSIERHEHIAREEPLRAKNHPVPRPLLPLPLFLDSIFALLTVGGNLAVALIFQHYRDRLESERLRKANAESQLSYLKAQINPHFYMNMLNNIHGMIDIDPVKAQDMLIDMSHLMRYMLYDSSHDRIGLTAEIDFLNNCLHIMRQRYPAERVAITAEFPDKEAASGVSLPPLLFLVFVENAFKHGISYQEHSFVSVNIVLTETDVKFICCNSRHAADPGHREGIGLHNVASRLKLLYADRAKLYISSEENTYSVQLTIPRT